MWDAPDEASPEEIRSGLTARGEPVKPALSNRDDYPDDPLPRYFGRGVVLPLVAIIAELIWRPCTALLFDPFPTGWHVASGFVGIVICALLPFLSERAWTRGWLRFLLAIGIGYALVFTVFYSLLLLPGFLLVGAVLIMVLPLGLLFGFPILAPYLQTYALLRLADHYSPELSGGKLRGTPRQLVLGALLGVMALFWLEAKPILQENLLESPQLGELRAVADPIELAAACRGLPSNRGLLADYGGESFGFRQRSPDAAPAPSLYYQVTGQALEDVDLTGRIPWSSPASFERRRWTSHPEIDVHQATPRVGHRVAGLSLRSSELVTKIEAAAGVGTHSWTLVFENEHAILPREARARLRLPPGGAVSGVTAWMKGVPREAAYGSVARVERAYKSVVPEAQVEITRRDPFLVAYDAPDRVRIHAYPVPVGGTMQVRIAITAPLEQLADGRSRFALPFFTERNFREPWRLAHRVDVHSTVPLRFESEDFDLPSRTGGTIELDPRDLDAGRRLEINSAPRDRLFTRDPDWLPTRAELSSFVETDVALPAAIPWLTVELRPLAHARPARCFVVLSGSKAMAEHLETLAEVFEEAPTGIEWHLLISGDPDEITWRAAATPGVLARTVRDFAAEGGRDDSLALERALAETRRPGDLVLWIHAAQPELLRELAPDSWSSVWAREPLAPDKAVPALEPERGVRVIELSVVEGRNRPLELLERAWRSRPREHSIETLPGGRHTSESLRELFESWREVSSRHALRFERPATGETNGQEVSGEAGAALARLGALSLIDELLRDGRASARHAAGELAAAYRLVTPVSSAVVLETDEEYDLHGLERPERKLFHTAALPEPGEIALFVVLALCLALAFWRKRRATRASAS